jgi:hypothetical protein
MMKKTPIFVLPGTKTTFQMNYEIEKLRWGGGES